MSNETVTTNEPLKKTFRSERGVYFAFVAQCDIESQMDVVRWLQNDSRYRVCTIVHNRDKDDEGVKKNAHIHGILKVGKKITAVSLGKRFGGYLHFELLHDAAEYAFYMLHRTFNSQTKAPYDKSELADDVGLWCEITDSEHDDDICGIVSNVLGYKDSSGNISISDMLKNQDALALRSVMSHSYFYNMFVNKIR